MHPSHHLVRLVELWGLGRPLKALGATGRRRQEGGCGEAQWSGWFKYQMWQTGHWSWYVVHISVALWLKIEEE